MSEAKDLKVRGKQEMMGSAEQTRPGMVFTPAVDIFETDTSITVLADIPGVGPGDVSIDLNDGVLTFTGEVKPQVRSDESEVLVEFETGKYYRQFTLSEIINQDRIEAKLDNGVLRLIMPKAEKAKPRKITINAG